MKKFTALIVSLLMVGALFAQTKLLDKNNAYYVYLKGTQTKITEEEYLNYAKVVEWETYRRYSNDEFEWDEQFALLKQKLDSFEKYNFFFMPKSDAKTFLQGRKNSQGDVNRQITLQITYKIAKFDSKEYTAFKELALSNDFLPIVGIIEKIEVYDASNSKNVKKIGELVKK